jgi:hypothetical protein
MIYVPPVPWKDKGAPKLSFVQHSTPTQTFTGSGLNARSACALISTSSTTGSHKVLDPDLDTTAALAKKTRKGLPTIGIVAFHPAHTHDDRSCVVHSRHLP